MTDLNLCARTFMTRFEHMYKINNKKIGFCQALHGGAFGHTNKDVHVESKDNILQVQENVQNETPTVIDFNLRLQNDAGNDKTQH